MFDDARLIRRCLALLDPGLRRLWAAQVGLALLCSVLETLGAAAVFVFISVVNDGTFIERLRPYPVISDLFIRDSYANSIIALALGLVALVITKNLISGYQIHHQESCAERSTVTGGERLFGGYMAAPYSYFLNRNSAEIIKNVEYSSDVVFRLMMLAISRVVAEVFVLVSMLGLLAYAQPLMTAVAFVLLGGTVTIVLAATRRRYDAWAREGHILNRKILQFLQQSLGSLREIKVVGREKYFLDQFHLDRSRRGKVGRITGTVSQLPRLTLETVTISALALMIAGAFMVGVDKAEIVPYVTLFAYAGFRLMPSISRLASSLQAIRHGAEPLEIISKEFSTLPEAAVQQAVVPVVTDFANFRLEDVSYVYPESDRPSLRDVVLDIPSGMTLGIAGPSGAGKSTMADIILGLLRPTSGRILLDGADITEMPAVWQSMIGFVPQSFYLTDDTLRRNIAFGIADEEIIEDQVVAAIEMAQLTEYVAGMPQKLDTIVGERGVRLSGGQRQRIALARALYSQPPVLIFDEATSALDAVTENELNRAIEALAGEKTIIIIAHRLTSLMHCDSILYMADGRITANGSFRDLVANNVDFANMVEAARVHDGAIS